LSEIQESLSKEGEFRGQGKKPDKSRGRQLDGLWGKRDGNCMQKSEKPATTERGGGKADVSKRR